VITSNKPLGTLGSVASLLLLAVTFHHRNHYKPLETHGSVASLLAVTFYHGNHYKPLGTHGSVASLLAVTFYHRNHYK
jgi:hypothetical protein